VITSYEAYVNTQVLKELSNVLQKKYKLPWESIRKVLLEVEAACTIFHNTEETILRATYLAERYGFSFYDSLIIASALATESTILFSEDLHHGQQIEEKLLIRNSFI
jgi:predicted nucleic acid-binding protein